MIPVDILEENEYSFTQLREKFQTEDDDKTRFFLNKLKNYGILKVKKPKNEESLNEYLEKDIESEFNNNEDFTYTFKYVGILIVRNFVIKCYPKYFKSIENRKEDFKQIIEVLEKYHNSINEPISFQNDINNSNFNLLSIMIFLIENYYTNGLYTDFQDIIETNGTGEILWNRTIDDFYPFIQNNKPYYMDLYTKNTIHDNENYFKRLHEVILTKCSKDLENADLLSLFGITSVNLSYKDLSDFGDKEYIKYRIRRELNVQFNSYKQSLLKAMYIYVKESDSFLGDINYFDAYGTTSYNLIWEEICRSVIGNKLKERLIDLKLISEINPLFDENTILSNIIDVHRWFLDYEDPIEGEPLKPDFITINKKNDETQFIIFDAKYYNLEDKEPGLKDVTKQFLYELAFKRFIELHHLKSINCFLFPIDKNKIINKGYVEFPMFKNLGLEKIEVILLPAKEMNELYLKNEPLKLSRLNIE